MRDCGTQHNLQMKPADFAALHPGYRRASSPLFFVRPGASRSFLCLPGPRGGVRNDWAKSRARGARMVLACGHPACRFRVGTRAVVQPIAEER